MHTSVKFAATKKGMSTALTLATAKGSDPISYSADRLTGGIGLLLEQGIAAGEVRGDVGPEDLLRALAGVCHAPDQPGWRKNVLRLVDIFVDGLRSRRNQRQIKKIAPIGPVRSKADIAGDLDNVRLAPRRNKTGPFIGRTFENDDR